MGKGRLESQVDILQKAVAAGLITTWETAIDGGAHLGLWSIEMSKSFRRVIAFEPVPENHRAAALALEAYPSVFLRRQALFSRACRVNIHGTGHSAYIIQATHGLTEAIKIDDLGLESCGLIKLDIEGAEYDALDGARETIERTGPALIIEIKRHGTRFGHDGHQIHTFLNRRGYQLALTAFPDFVFIRGIQ